MLVLSAAAHEVILCREHLLLLSIHVPVLELLPEVDVCVLFHGESQLVSRFFKSLKVLPTLVHLVLLVLLVFSFLHG